jgi:hypothetical protein
MFKQRLNSFTKIALCILALGVLTMAMPAMAQSCNSTSCTATIHDLYVTSNGGTPAQAQVYINLNVSGGPSNCTLISGLYFNLPPNTRGYDQQYSLLQEAASGGKTVMIRTNNGGNCTVGYVVLYP